MAFEPYPHQVDCLYEIAETRNHNKDRALIVMASGLGKTFTAATDVNRFVAHNPGKVLYLCHQNYILEQAEGTFKDVLPKHFKFGYYNGHRRGRDANCLFATFQTMQFHCDDFDPAEFKYVVVDESHHGPAPTYKPTLEYFKPEFLLALTATPDRTDLKDIRELYGSEVFSLPLEDALAQGLLTPVDYRLMTDELHEIDFLETTVGKVSIKELNRKMFVPRRDEEIARLILQHMTGVSDPRIMVFCSSIPYCERFAPYLPGSVTIHSDLRRKIQDDRLDDFRAGKTHTILTVDKFNEGIDVPEANIIVFLRSTSSRPIFFQQLGRGLRKAKSKQKVLVLDFAANCERLEVVHKLWQLVHLKYEQAPRRLNGTQLDKPVIVDYGQVSFAEEVKQVLDVIAQIRTGYTKEMLIKQLTDLNRELTKTPTERDVLNASRLGKCASPQTFKTMFGSFSAGLEAANLVPKVRRRNKEQLAADLQNLTQELGRTPTKNDVDEASQAGKMASANTYRSAFGTFNRALRAAKVKVAKEVGFTKRGILTQLKKFAAKLKHTPTVDEVTEEYKRTGSFPSYEAVRKTFGSFNAALEAAELPINLSHPTFSKLELKIQLQLLKQELGRTPTARDVNEASKAGKCASEPTFRAIFGAYSKAVEESGV